MAVKSKAASVEDDGVLVRVLLTQSHELPGGVMLHPGKVRVSKTLLEELKSLGKVAE